MVAFGAFTEQGSPPFARISRADDDADGLLAARAFSFAVVGMVRRLRTEIQSPL